MWGFTRAARAVFAQRGRIAHGLHVRRMSVEDAGDRYAWLEWRWMHTVTGARMLLAGSLMALLATGAAVADEFPCTEAGVRDAIAQGGGPHGFACAGPTTVATAAEIRIEGAVVLDGGGLLTLDGGDDHRLLHVAPDADAVVRGMTLTRGRTFFSTQWGGALRNDGDLVLEHVEVTHSVAYTRGGGIANTGSLVLRDCRVAHNGFIDRTPGVRALQGGGIYGDSGSIRIESSVIEDNLAEGNGGIASLGSLEVHQSRIVRNADGGMGVNGPVVITESIIAGNTGGSGAAMHMGRESQVTIIGTTIRDNYSPNSAGALAVGGELVLLNSTVTGNSAALSRSGGIDVFHPGSSALILHSTIVDNEGIDAGGLYIFQGQVVLRGTIVAGNRSSAGVDCPTGTNQAFFTSAGGNVFEAGGCPAGAEDVVVPPGVAFTEMLGPLADNGGPTRTYLPLRGSAALDVVPDARCQDAAFFPIGFDQRGLPRPWDGDGDGVARCDAGAVERVVRHVDVRVWLPRVGRVWHRLARGLIFAALHGSEDLEVRDVVRDSVALGPDAASPLGRRPFLRDLNRDGEADLLLVFRHRDTGIAPRADEACLVAALHDGSLIEGCGEVERLRRRHRR